MNKSQLTRHNHYVPQAYLRRWSSDGDAIWTYRTLVSAASVRKWELRPIRGSARLRDLYTLFSGDSETDEFEHWITREFEEPGLASVEKVVSCQRMRPVDWQALGRYVALQDIRTPRAFVEAMTRFDDAIPKVLDGARKRLVEALDSGQLAKMSESAAAASSLVRVSFEPPSSAEADATMKVAVSVGRALWLETLRYVLGHAAEALAKHRWSIIAPFGELEWVTSDHPVVKMNFNDFKDYNLDGGWGSKNTNIFMPLSPRHLLVTQVGTNARFDRIPLDLTLLLQKCIVARSYRSVFALSPRSEVVQFRPRVIDAKKFTAERDQWSEFHERQREVES